MHLFCDVIIRFTLRRNSVEMFNEASMNTKVLKYLGTKELSENIEEFKVIWERKFKVVWERKFNDFLMVLIFLKDILMTKKLLLLLIVKSIWRLVIKRSKRMVIFKLIVNKRETVQEQLPHLR